MSSRSSSGFTLIELGIALAVLAVILTAAIPAMGRFFEQQRLTTAANGLAAHLQFARGEAISRHTIVTACPSEDGNRCTGTNRWDRGWIIYRDPQRLSQPAGPEDVLRVVAAQPGYVFHSGGRYRVRFRGSGVAYGTNLTIHLCPQDRTARGRAVIVSNPGRVRVRRDLQPSACQGLE